MKIVILSGAGLSAESGIETFRSDTGLWANHDVNKVASLKGFRNNPTLVHDFYNDRRAQLQNVEPNAAHFALAKLEKVDGLEVLHVTQNVDNLCERAGSKNLIHMHGELLKARCQMCGEVFDGDGETSVSESCPECGFTSKWGGLRPHIVWFGEMPFKMNEIEKAISNCDIFVAIGTSGKVYPAAGLVKIAKSYGAKTILINRDEPDNLLDFDQIIQGKASIEVPKWVGQLLNGG